VAVHSDAYGIRTDAPAESFAAAVSVVQARKLEAQGSIASARESSPPATPSLLAPDPQFPSSALAAGHRFGSSSHRASEQVSPAALSFVRDASTTRAHGRVLVVAPRGQQVDLAALADKVPGSCATVSDDRLSEAIAADDILVLSRGVHRIDGPLLLSQPNLLIIGDPEAPQDVELCFDCAGADTVLTVSRSCGLVGLTLTVQASLPSDSPKRKRPRHGQQTARVLVNSQAPVVLTSVRIRDDAAAVRSNSLLSLVDGAVVCLTNCDLDAVGVSSHCVVAAGRSALTVSACTLRNATESGLSVQSSSLAYVDHSHILQCQKSAAYVHGLSSLAILRASSLEKCQICLLDVTHGARAIVSGSFLGNSKGGGVRVRHFGSRVVFQPPLSRVDHCRLAGADIREEGLGVLQHVRFSHIRTSAVYLSLGGRALACPSVQMTDGIGMRHFELSAHSTLAVVGVDGASRFSTACSADSQVNHIATDSHAPPRGAAEPST
jgi:hypothetical protein